MQLLMRGKALRTENAEAAMPYGVCGPAEQTRRTNFGGSRSLVVPAKRQVSPSDWKGFQGVRQVHDGQNTVEKAVAGKNLRKD